MTENNLTEDHVRRYPNEDSGFFHAQNHFHAVSLSGGKDSTCLLLLMIERGMPIDAVISADTGMEFPEMYEHLAKVDEYLFRERGLHMLRQQQELWQCANAILQKLAAIA